MKPIILIPMGRPGRDRAGGCSKALAREKPASARQIG